MMILVGAMPSSASARPMVSSISARPIPTTHRIVVETFQFR